MKWRALRWVSEFPTMVSNNECTRPLSVSSVSTSGARLSGFHNFEEGEKISISCLQQKIPATVVWVGEDAFGIEFMRPIGRKELSIIRKPGGTGNPAGVFREPVSGNRISGTQLSRPNPSISTDRARLLVQKILKTALCQKDGTSAEDF